MITPRNNGPLVYGLGFYIALGFVLLIWALLLSLWGIIKGRAVSQSLWAAQLLEVPQNREDLIEMKTVSGRAQDLADIERLRKSV